MKKSINKELYNSIKKERLIDLYFRNKDEPYEEVINISLDEEVEEKIENELSSELIINNKTNFIKNFNFFENNNSEMQNKIDKNNEFNFYLNSYSNLNENENKNYINNDSIFDIYKFEENSNQINLGPDSQMSSNFNYLTYPLKW